MLSLKKITPFGQGNSPHARIAASSSINAVSFSSARTTNRFPSSRCASAIQIVRPLQSNANTQPQLHPAFWTLSAMISQSFIESSRRKLQANGQKRLSASLLAFQAAHFYRTNNPTLRQRIPLECRVQDAKSSKTIKY
jgi:hypothetical protein